VTAVGAGSGSWQRVAATTTGILAVVLMLLHCRALAFFTEDDAYIVARYARSLAQGQGLVYNMSEREWGCTTTLLPALQAPLYLAGVAPVVTAKLIGALAACASIVVTILMTRRHAPLAATGLAALPVAAFGPLALWAVGGLETAIFAGLVVTALAFALDERNREADARVPASVVFLIAATLARPDAPLYAPAVMLARWRAHEFRRAIRWAALFGAGLVILWSLHAAYYGALLPNPLQAKVLGAADRLRTGFEYAREFMTATSGLIGLALLGALASLALGPEERRHATLAVSIALLSALAYAVWTGGDWMPEHRFFAPVVLFAAPLWVWGLAAITGRWQRHRMVIWSAGVCCILIMAASEFGQSRGWMLRLRVLRTANDTFLRLGEDIRGGDGTLLYAIADIGGFGWSSDAKILDLGGLADRYIARASHGTVGPKVLPELMRRRPDVVLAKLFVADAAQRRHLCEAAVALELGPLPPATVATLMRDARAQPDQDVLEYVARSPSYRLVAIPGFSALPQFYLVFANQDAIPRVSERLRNCRIGSGRAHYAIGDIERGLTLMRAQFANEPYNDTDRYEAGIDLLNRERTEDAIRMLEEAVAIDRRNADAHFALGMAYSRVPDIAAAISSYRAYLRLRTRDARGYNNLAMALASAERYAEALAIIETAVKLDPGFDLARNNRNWIKQQLEEHPSEAHPESGR
jgi:tetratricopeptide (TPR) repeat protein